MNLACVTLLVLCAGIALAKHWHRSKSDSMYLAQSPVICLAVCFELLQTTCDSLTLTTFHRLQALHMRMYILTEVHLCMQALLNTLAQKKLRTAFIIQALLNTSTQKV